MKLVYFMETLAGKGGTEKVLATKSAYFADVLGYEVHIFILQDKQKLLAYDYSKNIHFHYLGTKVLNENFSVPILHHRLRVLELRRMSEELFKTIQPDIIIGLGLGIGDFVFPHVAKKLKIPTIREYHYSTIAAKNTIALTQPFIRRKKLAIEFKRMFSKLKKYNKLVLLTQQDAEEGKYTTPHVVIPNVLNQSDEAGVSKLVNKRVISVGSMRSRIKRFDRQIELWREVVKTRPEWQLDIYGDGVERSHLQSLIDSYGLNDNVTLHGNVNNISDKYLESSVFIMTSDGEGLPMVIIEAMSYGLPCVSYKCSCGPLDVIREGIDGYVIEMDDRTAFLENLYEVMDNEDLRLQMGKNAKERSLDYTSEKIMPMWVNLFNEVKDINIS
nr:glycosyltransferase family 4 protein [uncultured Carboxylicivirga sp.]